MTCLRTILAAPVLALALTACADKPSGPPFDGASHDAQLDPAAMPGKAPAEKAEYKKPVRMNGRGKVSSISLEDFFLLHQSGKTLVIDARPSIFHQFGHIPGAISLPAKNCDPVIAGREEEIRKAVADGKTIVTYCTGLLCPDARTVAMHISGFGYPASVFSGGWDAWKEAGMPVE
jgi:3-mercaptopyruvate sulfurtransferase SseA